MGQLYRNILARSPKPSHNASPHALPPRTIMSIAMLVHPTISGGSSHVWQCSTCIGAGRGEGFHVNPRRYLLFLACAEL